MKLQIIRFVILFSLLLSGKSLQAQIFPPDFQCIKSDSLFWLAPVNTCGPFVSVDIYSSTQATGPFTLLTSITDPMQLFYEDPNPISEVRYYYLLSNFNCPGETAIPSDTLAVGNLGDSDIQAVTVQGSDVLITWETSSSPQVSAYVIYRTTPIGTIPIDTVFGNAAFSYLDTTADPENGEEFYYVLAQDPCGNASSFLDPHNTIYLTAIGESCDEAINLNWNPYSSWNNAIDRQEVWYTENGGAEILAATLDAQASSFNFTAVTLSADYCFYIRNIESGTNAESNSNLFCLTAKLSPAQKDLFLTNLSVRNNNEVELSWYWDLEAELNSYEFMRGTMDNNLALSFSGLPGILLNNEISRIDPGSDASQGTLFYQINTIDDCGRNKLSNLGQTIFLSGLPNENLTNQLNWTPLIIDGVQVEEYRLFRSKGFSTTEIALDMVDALSGIDPIDATDPQEVEICYQVMAETSTTLPNGDMAKYESWSNKVCLLQTSIIRLPNAFAPSGVNNLFRPYIVFSEDISFEMKIFNRWGEQIFETTDFLRGWDGTDGLQEVPMGVYAYHIEIVQAGKEPITKVGIVALLR